MTAVNAHSVPTTFRWHWHAWGWTNPGRTSAFFRHSLHMVTCSVPLFLDYVGKLQRCWVDPKSLFCHSSGSRALADMQDASTYGLDQMPAVEPTIA